MLIELGSLTPRDSSLASVGGAQCGDFGGMMGGELLRAR